MLCAGERRAALGVVAQQVQSLRATDSGLLEFLRPSDCVVSTDLPIDALPKLTERCSLMC